MRRFAPLLILSFTTVMLFGILLSAPVAHPHDTNCPFAEGCVTTIEHINHWNAAFAGTLGEIVLLLAVALLWFVSTLLPRVFTQEVRFKQRTRIPIRPPFFQELYSQGILNRKEPHVYL